MKKPKRSPSTIAAVFVSSGNTINHSYNQVYIDSIHMTLPMGKAAGVVFVDSVSN